MKANSVLLIGYVGLDLASTTTIEGTKRVVIRMATHYNGKDQNGSKFHHTVWHDIIAWDRTADYAIRNFVKGSKIMVEGLIVYRTYLDNTGHTRYVTEIKASSFLNLDR